jgi:hypothetical protein
MCFQRLKRRILANLIKQTQIINKLVYVFDYARTSSERKVGLKVGLKAHLPTFLNVHKIHYPGTRRHATLKMEHPTSSDTISQNPL